MLSYTYKLIKYKITVYQTFICSISVLPILFYWSICLQYYLCDLLISVILLIIEVVLHVLKFIEGGQVLIQPSTTNLGANCYTER